MFMAEKEMELGKYDAKSWFVSAVLGLFIGLAIIVPGISGATIAIIFALYGKLIYALGNIFKHFKSCFMFLLPILLGAVVGLIVGFFAVQKLFELMPFTIICLFAGLMVGAFPAVCDEIKPFKASPLRIVLLCVGVLVPILIGVLSIVFAGKGNGTGAISLSPWAFLLYFVLGMVVSVTQIVPGLSASAILMAFGLFGPLLASLHFSYIKETPMILLVYLALIAGFIVGIVLFSKALNYLLNNKKAGTFFTIVGLSAGSVVSMFINPDVYSVYVAWSAGSTNFVWDLVCGILLFVVGLIGAFALVAYERKKKKVQANLSEGSHNNTLEKDAKLENKEEIQ